VCAASAEGWLSIRKACRLLGYSKQAFHKRAKTATFRAQHAAHCIEEVVEAVADVRVDMPRLGTRKLYYLLSDEFEQAGLKVGRDKLFSILKDANLLIRKKKRYTKTTDSSQWRRQHDNLVEGYVPQKPEELLVADITYFDTEQGTAYGHLVTDAYSKKIMGYEVAYDMKKERTIAAFNMAMKNRQYDHQGVHHSDRGAQYCAYDYVNNARDNNYDISMTQDGSPYDNAVAERINGILKDEFALGDKMKDLVELKEKIARAVEIYNNQRPHMSCHLLTPNQMHQQQELKIVTWRKKVEENSTKNE
jgi:putative transposase